MVGPGNKQNMPAGKKDYGDGKFTIAKNELTQFSSYIQNVYCNSHTCNPATSTSKCRHEHIFYCIVTNYAVYSQPIAALTEQLTVGWTGCSAPGQPPTRPTAVETASYFVPSSKG